MLSRFFLLGGLDLLGEKRVAQSMFKGTLLHIGRFLPSLFSCDSRYCAMNSVFITRRQVHPNGAMHRHHKRSRRSCLWSRVQRHGFASRVRFLGQNRQNLGPVPREEQKGSLHAPDRRARVCVLAERQIARDVRAERNDHLLGRQRRRRVVHHRRKKGLQRWEADGRRENG